MYPIDTVKTRVQVSPVPLGMREAWREVLRERGFTGLMRGSSVIGAGCIPAHIGLFGTYELAMARLVDRQEHQPVRTAACGGFASVVHDIVLTPCDVVKQRLQMGRYLGTKHCVASMLRQEGLGAFYRSLPATLAMNVPFTGVLVASNESLKLLLKARQGEADTTLSTAPAYFACAGLSGAVASALTSPLDVVKTRLQTQEVVLSGGLTSKLLQPQGILTVARAIVQEEGLRGMFRGAVPRMLLSAPAAAISWGTYETVRKALEDFSQPEGKRGHAGLFASSSFSSLVGVNQLS